MTPSPTQNVVLRGIAAVVCAGVVLAGPVAASADPTGHSGISVQQHAARGSIVSVRHVQHLTPAEITAALRTDGFDVSRVRYGVDAYRLIYRTIDLHGARTTASGLVVLPRNGQRELRVVNYAHGTMAGASEAPSTDDGGRSDEGMMIGSAGYAVVAPDYLGLGEGPGFHPYLHAASEASASVDMLRAAFAFSHRAGRHFDPRILATGFSQGGTVAMLVGKALQDGAIPGLRPAAVAGISGPYVLQNAELRAIFDGRLDPKDAAYYTGYLLTSWNRIYHLYDTPSEAFQAPYDTTVAPLYNGKHSDEEIFAALPDSYVDLLTPEYLEKLRHPTGVLAAALRENDQSCNWTPRIPVRLYAAHGDEQVAISNTYQCQAQFAQHGVQVPVIDVGDYHHTGSGQHGLAAALGYFTSVAPPRR